MRKFLSLVCVVASVTPESARAQSPDSAQPLGTVVISASKVPKPASTLSQAVTVISGDDLRARGVTRVTDALREVPGAQLVQNGSYGAVTSLFLRGGESRYTKVLIDGVPVNTAGGFFDFSHLTTDNVERIEIVRGPASVLYGADAASGIVQIFTRKNSAERNASLGIRGGTYRSFDADADISGTTGPAGYTFAAGRHSTDGILPFNNQYSNGTLSSALSLRSNAAGEARISGRYTAAEFHYPTDYTGLPVDTNSYRTQHRLTVGVDLLRNLGSAVQGRIALGSNDVIDLTEDIATPFGASVPQHSAFRSRGYRRNAEARVSLFLPVDATLTVGAGYEKEHEHSSNDAGGVGLAMEQTDAFSAARHNVAYYSELLGNIGERASYTLSGRLDDNSDYDRFGTYRIGTTVEVFPTVRIRGSLSTAFTSPAFNQLRPTLYTVGSPDLRPERIRAGEIGIRLGAASGAVAASASYFAQRFADLIQYVSGGPPDFKGSYANLTAATSNGYEAELEVLPRRNLRGTLSFTVVAPRVRDVPPGYQGSDNVGDELLRRPTHSGNLLLSYAKPGSVSLSAAAQYVGKRADLDFAQFPSPRVTLPAHTTVDLAAQYPLGLFRRGSLTLNGRIENLFNTRFENVLHFPGPGRVLLIGARANTAF